MNPPEEVRNPDSSITIAFGPDLRNVRKALAEIPAVGEKEAADMVEKIRASLARGAVLEPHGPADVLVHPAVYGWPDSPNRAQRRARRRFRGQGMTRPWPPRWSR